MFRKNVGPGGAAAMLLALVLVAAGCGGDDSGGGGGTIALLLPENHTPRYEASDRPDFEKKVKELCSDCKLLYSNATQDAAKQQNQADAALTQGAEVLVAGRGRRGLRRRDREEGQGAERARRQLRPADHGLRRRLLRLVRQRRASASCRATR